MLKCKTCGKELKEEDEGRTWRRCSICKQPVCFDDIHYIGVWVRGKRFFFANQHHVNVIPVGVKTKSF